MLIIIIIINYFQFTKWYKYGYSVTWSVTWVETSNNHLFHFPFIIIFSLMFSWQIFSIGWSNFLQVCFINWIFVEFFVFFKTFLILIFLFTCICLRKILSPYQSTLTLWWMALFEPCDCSTRFSLLILLDSHRSESLPLLIYYFNWFFFFSLWNW